MKPRRLSQPSSDCRMEAERLEAPLALFREFVRHWSGQCIEYEENPMTTSINYADHYLERLLLHASLDTPWYRGFIRNLRDAVHAPHLPLLEVSSRPIAVKSIWGLYPRQKRSWAFSLALQSLAVAMLFAAVSSPTVRHAAREVFMLQVPVDISTYKPTVQGGGGGGDRSTQQASQGKLPKPALKQFTPPTAVVRNPDAKLTIDPSILIPPDVPLPQIASTNYGDPFSKLVAPSNGPGSSAGIGSGANGGVGPGNGPGVGPGSEGGINGAVFHAGAGVSAPALLYKVEPEYSEEARKAKYQGVVVLTVVVDAAGHVTNPRVVRSLGLGLDEKAMEAVQKWKFRPGYKDGRSVPVSAEIEVSFRLL